MDLKIFAGWLEDRDFAQTIASSTWMFPAIEVVHVVALTLVVGSIAMLDLRLIGVARHDRGVIELTAETLPWTWSAFIVAVVSGALMFSSAATKYFSNTPFQIKMLLLLLAGVNMAVFHLTIHTTVDRWNHARPAPRSARIAGLMSLLFWIGVVVFGRWVGFVDQHPVG